MSSTASDDLKIAQAAERLAGYVWVTRDARKHYPTEMETSHILNTLRMIRDGRMRKQGRSSCSGYNLARWDLIFCEELKRRSINPEQYLQCAPTSALLKSVS